jgi:hypothetical protein
MRFLREMQQGIEIGQVRRFDPHLGGRRKFGTRPGQGADRFGGQQDAARQQDSQGVVHGSLVGVGGVKQNLQVLLGAESLVVSGTELVVRQAEPRRREEILPVGVVGERPRLADQRVDHVSVVNRVPVPTYQSRQRVHLPIGEPDFDAVGEEPGLHLFADPATVDGVGVAVQMNQTSRVHSTADFQTRRQALVGQIPQRSLFLGEPIGASGIARSHDAVQELQVLLTTGEIPTAPQQEGLIDGGLEVPVRRLGVAVLVRLPDVDPLAGQAVVGQPVAVPGLELPRRREVVHRRTQAVAAMATWHAAQLPQSRLQPFREGLERLRDAHRDRLPVGVGEHEVVHQVIERLAGDGDRKRVHAREVRRGEVARLVDLAEDDRAVRPVQGPPLPHPPLEGPAVGVEKRPGMLTPEPVEEGLGGELRLGLEPLLDLDPDLGERVDPGAVGAGGFPRTGQLAPIPILACGLLAHPRSPCGQVQRKGRLQLPPQLTYLTIRDHCVPPRCWKRQLHQLSREREF